MHMAPKIEEYTRNNPNALPFLNEVSNAIELYNAREEMVLAWLQGYEV
jgi:hypothetical protein